MKENLLEDWSIKMKEFVWRNGLVGHSPFSDIEKIKDNLVFFFDKKAFEYDPNIPKPDQIYSLISTIKTSSLFKLAEIANTISFYRQKKDFNILNLHGKKRRLTYDEIQGKLFELFINKVLINNGLQTEIDQIYTDSNNIIHPIDISFNFQNIPYLVECYKVENHIREHFTKLIYNLNKYALKISYGFTTAELFSGYIIFKIEPITPEIIHNTGIIFKKALNEFIVGFRNPKNRIVKLDFQFENSFIDFKLFSNLISSKFDLKEIAKSGVNSLVFNTVLHGESYGRVTFDFTVNYVHRNYLHEIIEKLQIKKQQHKNSPIKNKIIVVEFENIKDNKTYRGSIPIIKQDVSRLDFSNLVDTNTTILFWLKTISSTKYTTNVGLAASNVFNKDLKSRLLSIKINWC